jgi:4-hydroxyphenylacetate 3-monooxygenase
MALRTGAEYLESLDDGREVWLNGQRVDVRNHPQLCGYASALASIFDLQHEAEFRGLLTTTSPRTGEVVSMAWHLPRNTADLKQSREMFEFLERRAGGVLGRFPQYMASLVMGLYHLRHDVRRVNTAWAENIELFYDHCRERDLSVAFSASDPIRNRKLPPSAIEYLTMVEKRDDGIVVRGAKMVATHAAYADEILVLTTGRKEAGERDNLYFAVPSSTPGLKIVCRQPLSHPGERDHEVSSRWDEVDASLIFDDVLIPWSRVFFIENRTESPLRIPAPWGFYYGMLRVLIKAEVLVGIAFAASESLGTRDEPHVQNMLGEAVTFLLTLRTVLRDAEQRPMFTGEGLAMPDPSQVALARTLDLQSHARLVEIVRLICGTALITTPSSGDLDDPELGPFMQRFIAGSDPGARDRFRLMKLAWDYTSDSFAGRQLVFEEHNAVNLAGRHALLLESFDSEPAVALAKRLAGIT